MSWLLEIALSNAVMATVLGLLVLVVSRFCHRPALIHGLWLVVLLKLVTPPVVSVPVEILPASVVVADAADDADIVDTPVPVEAMPVEDAVFTPVTLATVNEKPFPPQELLVSDGELDADGLPLIAVEFDEPAAPDETSAAVDQSDDTVFADAADVAVMIGSEEQDISDSRAGPVSGPPPEELPSEATEPATASSAGYAALLKLLAVCLIAVWIVGSIVVVLTTVVRVRRFQKLLCVASPAPAWLTTKVDRLAKQMGLKRAPQVLIVPATLSPMLWAIGRKPKLILPEELVQRLEQPELESILLHELAHMRRGDHWVRGLELLASCLYWWHPVVWLARREIQMNEEACCDAWVVWRLSGGGTPYAKAILATVDFLADSRPALPPVASGLARVEFLKRRLTMILEGTTPRRLSSVGRIAVLVVGAGLLPLLPTLGEEQPTEQEEPAVAAATDLVADSDKEDKANDATPADAAQTTGATAKPVVRQPRLTLPEPTDFEAKPQSYLDEPGRNWRLAVSPDGKRLAVSYSGRPQPGRVRVFDIETPKELANIKEPMGIPSVGFSPDGRWLIYGRWDSIIKILDAESFEVVAELELGWPGGSRFAVSPDNKLIATIAEGKPDAKGILRGQVKLWEMPTGKFITVLEGDMFRLHDVNFSPDGKLLAVGGGQWKENLMGQVNLWDIETRKQVKTLKGHTQAVLSATFSPDGQTIATGSRDNSVRLWNLADGSVKATLQGHASTVERTVFSPDGKLLATTGWDGTAKLWRVEDGSVQATLRGHTSLVHTADFTPDGKTLATASEDGIVRLWDVTTGLQTATLEQDVKADDNPEAILTVAWSSDGKTVASAHEDKTVRLRDAETGEVTRVLDAHDDVVANIAFSPDGTILATASYDKLIKLWDVATGKELRTLSGPTNWVFSVAFSPDGNRLASSGYDKTVRLWDIESGAEKAKLEGHSATVRSIAFSPDGKLLASGSGDRTVRIWDTESLKELATLSGHKGSVRAVAYSPDGKTIASGSEDQTVKLWDVESRKERATLSGHTGMVWSLAFSPRGKTLASGGFDNVIKLWNPNSGAERATLKGHTDVVTSLAFAPDTSALISGSYDKSIKVWRSTQPSIPPLVSMTAHDSQTRFIVFSPDGRKMVTGAMDHVAKVWDLKTGKPVHILSGHTQGILCGALSSDGKTLATGGFDQTIRFWNIQTGALLATLSDHKGTIMSLVFSPDGRKLASGSSDKTVKLWDVDTRQVTRTLPVQPLWVTGVAFSPDGKTLASSTGNWDEWQTAGEVKLWNVANGEALATFQGHANAIGSVKFSLDGNLIAAPGWDKTVRFWDAKTLEPRDILKLDSGAIQVSFLPDGHSLAVSEFSGRVSLWNLEKMVRLATFEGHDKNAHEVTHSPDGSLIASAGLDGLVKLWPTSGGAEIRQFPAAGPWTLGVAYLPDGRHILTSRGPNNSFQMLDVETGQEVRRFAGHTKPVTALAISPDGKQAISGSQDLTVRIWDIQTGEQLREFSGHEKEPRSVAISPDGRYAVSGAFGKKTTSGISKPTS